MLIRFFMEFVERLPIAFQKPNIIAQSLRSGNQNSISIVWGNGDISPINIIWEEANEILANRSEWAVLDEKAGCVILTSHDTFVTAEQVCTADATIEFRLLFDSLEREAASC